MPVSGLVGYWFVGYRVLPLGMSRAASGGIGGCGASERNGWLQFTIPCNLSEEREEQAYEDLCYVTISAELYDEVPANFTVLASRCSLSFLFRYLFLCSS